MDCASLLGYVKPNLAVSEKVQLSYSFEWGTVFRSEGGGRIGFSQKHNPISCCVAQHAIPGGLLLKVTTVFDS